MKEVVKFSSEVVKTWEAGDLFYWEGFRYVDEMSEFSPLVGMTVEETSDQIREVTSKEAIDFRLKNGNPLKDVPTQDLLDELSNRLK